MTVTESVGANNTRLYKITEASEKPEIAYDTVVSKSDGWADLPTNGEVVGTKDQVITVVEVTIELKVRAKGEAILPEPTSGE